MRSFLLFFVAWIVNPERPPGIVCQMEKFENHPSRRVHSRTRTTALGLDAQGLWIAAQGRKLPATDSKGMTACSLEESFSSAAVHFRKWQITAFVTRADTRCTALAQPAHRH